MTNSLKGDAFQNRFRITGILKTLSPLHIGTGDESDTLYSENRKEQYRKKNIDVPKVSTIIKDYRGKPLIPGSSLRGSMRNWLLAVLFGVGDNWVATRSYEDRELVELSQKAQIDMARNDFSVLERLFGTSFNAGKLEVWDASCITNDLKLADELLDWNSKSLTYIDTSVAIDPNTGTALDKLLYKTELVPQGVEFEVNLAGQNLSEDELGLILFALQGFNSFIYPIHLGARAGRGFGRFSFQLNTIYTLGQSDIKTWISHSIQTMNFSQTPGETANAGYYGLKAINAQQQQTLITSIKTKMLAQMGN